MGTRMANWYMGGARDVTHGRNRAYLQALWVHEKKKFGCFQKTF